MFYLIDAGMFGKPLGSVSPGLRTFTPSSAANGFLYVGGPAVTLSLVAMAPDDGSLYAAVKVLLSVLETSPPMQQEMNRINGYKVCLIVLE